MAGTHSRMILVVEVPEVRVVAFDQQVDDSLDNPELVDMDPVASVDSLADDIRVVDNCRVYLEVGTVDHLVQDRRPAEKQEAGTL